MHWRPSLPLTSPLPFFQALCYVPEWLLFWIEPRWALLGPNRLSFPNRMTGECGREVESKAKDGYVGGILPEWRILSYRLRWQNDSVSLCLSASGSVPLGGSRSGSVASLPVSCGFLKSEALWSARQSAGPATQLQCQACLFGAFNRGTKTLRRLLHLLSPNLNANVIVPGFDGTNWVQRLCKSIWTGSKPMFVIKLLTGNKTRPSGVPLNGLSGHCLGSQKIGALLGAPRGGSGFPPLGCPGQVQRASW